LLAHTKESTVFSILLLAKNVRTEDLTASSEDDYEKQSQDVKTNGMRVVEKLQHNSQIPILEKPWINNAPEGKKGDKTYVQSP
jgi:hypothetical protein